ncbi:MAG TPA: acyl--CoA ligase [Gallicola sp.]|nr:acyl--CoA ligase [Gallicola sp.]
MKEKKLTGYASIDKPHNKGYSFFARNPIIPSLSVYSTIYLLNKFNQAKDAVNSLDLTVSYERMFDDAVTVSRSLKAFGIKKGDIISVSMPNLYQAVVIFLAANRIGAVTTFLNPGASVEEITDYLNLFESSVFFNYAKTEEENTKYIKKSNLQHIITLNKNKINSRNLELDPINNSQFISYNALGDVAKYINKGLPNISSKDNSLILFTSGTTGKPKSVVLTNENIIAAGIYLKNDSKVESLKGETSLVCVPFSYPYGFATSLLMTLMSKKTAILAPDISPETISYYLAKNPNIIFGSPALLSLIMNNVKEDQDLSSVTTYISGGDFLPINQYEKGIEFFKSHGAIDFELGNGSGNAETVSCGTNPTGIEVRPGTVGKVLVGTDAMVVNPETMEEKKYHKEGLLCVSGKHVFKEYYKEPELTKEVKYKKGSKTYFKTGTIGSIDEDGYFTLKGRESRFYIDSSLNKVYCDHVQRVISNLEGISECAVVKVPDDKKLYVNKAYIVLDEGLVPSEQLKEKIYLNLLEPVININQEKEQLKDFEIPDSLEFISLMPRREGTDKIDYALLESEALKNTKLKQDNQLVKKI